MEYFLLVFNFYFFKDSIWKGGGGPTPGFPPPPVARGSGVSNFKRGPILSTIYIKTFVAGLYHHDVLESVLER
jgi:hypothetical protein